MVGRVMKYPIIDCIFLFIGFSSSIKKMKTLIVINKKKPIKTRLQYLLILLFSIILRCRAK
jgi:hypothetical protein